MAHILGIDSSTKFVHAVCLDDNGDICSLLKSAGLIDGTRDSDYCALWLVKNFESLYNQQKCDDSVSLFIENPVYIQNVKTSFTIAAIVFGIKTLWFNKDVYFTGVDVRSWKKDVLGNGKADKAAIMAFAKTRWGDAITEQDFADAACIALYGLRRLGKQKGIKYDTV